MRTDVPYEPIVEHRNPVWDWLVVKGIETWYATPVSTWPTKLTECLRHGKQPPVDGTPSGDIPDPKGGYKVAVFGDMGEGSSSEVRNVANALKWQPQYVATVGDNVYPLGREVDWQRRFDPQFAELRRTATWRPTLGNHDYYSGDLRPYFNRFGAETGNQAYYSWKLGPADFFVIDTEQRLDSSSAQRAWLEQQLAASTAAYKVVQMHRPMVGTESGASGSADYGSLAPLLAKYGVQLVLAGHVHGYERSRDIDGTTFVVAGGGGATSTAYAAGLPKTTVVRSMRHHHLQLAFDAASMVVRAVDEQGGVMDAFTVKPHGAAPTADAAAGAAATAGAASPAAVAPR